jgi:hypothetical protein
MDDVCRREVSLADAIKKPIVPLLLERMSWPPEGPMSMVFSQLLYIDFCKPDENIQNNWQCPQFDQLLQQISLNLQPTDPVIDIYCTLTCNIEQDSAVLH